MKYNDFLYNNIYYNQIDNNSLYNKRNLVLVFGNDEITLNHETLYSNTSLDMLNIINDNKNQICAILLFINSPTSNDYTLCENIKSIKELNNIPSIIVSQINDIDIQKKFFELNIYDFIFPPYDNELINIKVDNAIQNSNILVLEKLKYLSDYDSLTHIYNKSKFFEVTHKNLIDNLDKQFCFVVFDIDRFNLINSYFGSDEGDKLLKFIANQMKKIITHENCTFGRIVADVFGFCIPYDGYKLIEFIVDDCKSNLIEYNPNYNIVPSFGVYVIQDNTTYIRSIFQKANTARKQCKGNYNVNCKFYDELLDVNLKKEQEIINDMMKALNENQFVVYLQPKYDLKTNTPAGAEALVRWKHPQKGLIPPNEFIPIFERNGFITKLDYYVWEVVCKLIRLWINQGKNPNPISVNVSRVNFYNPRLVDIICDLVDKYKIPPELFNLELTESAYTDNPEMLKETMKRLQDRGFIIMMDDFGSGYSSLNVLKDITVDVLKIDMKFLSKSEIIGRGENIVASIVRMAKWLNIPTITEGVETSKQVEFLKEIGCEYVQGYYFAKPMPISEYENFIEDNNLNKKNVSTNFNMNELWGNNSQIEALFSNVMQAIAIYEYDEQSKSIEIIRVNNAFYDLFGFADMNSENNNFISLIRDDYQNIIYGIFDQAIKNKNTAEGDYIKRISANKSMWIHIKLKYINSIGNKHIILGSLSDISDQKELDLELQKYRNAISSTSINSNKILVVDDMEVNRELLYIIFEDEFTILSASNGKEAIEVLKQNDNHVDIILLDLFMPIMNGIEFLNYKKTHEEISNIPVVIITADDSAQQQVNMLALGANDYIVKPFVEETVVRRVKNVIESNFRFRQILKEYENVVRKSNTDALTGINNRTSIENIISNILKSNSNTTKVFVMIDIDNFKIINDTFGHECGDYILMDFANRLKYNISSKSCVARLGGDEFCIFNDDISSKDEFLTPFSTLNFKPIILKYRGNDITLSCSIGIAFCLPNENLDFSTLYKNADLAMYQSKKTGKGKVTVFTKELYQDNYNPTK